MTSVQFGSSALPERFWDKCIPEPMGGCWLWLGAISGSDQRGRVSRYGVLKWPGGPASKQVKAHVVAVMASGRIVSDDMEIDHRCDVTFCVNPDHLDVVTHRENVERHWRRHPLLTCKNGHPATPENRYLGSVGHGSQCKLCWWTEEKKIAQRKKRDGAA